MLARYIDGSGTNDHAFRTAYAVLGAQRNLRILGVFARLATDYGKPHYVDLIPRVWAHLVRDLDHPALAPVAQMLADTLPAPTPETLQRLTPMRKAPEAVMLFAAGFGTRMGALTRDRPKPLIEVAGRPLIDHALALAEAIAPGADRRQYPLPARDDRRASGRPRGC